LSNTGIIIIIIECSIKKRGNMLFLNYKPVIVIGMHRSGTSLFTRILNDSGVFMGYDMGVNAEAKFFQQINISLLKKNKAKWNDPKYINNSTKIKMNYSDFAREYLGVFKSLYLGNNHIDFLKTYRKYYKLLVDYEWGWKDPRNTYTLDYWLNIFPEAKVINIVRNGVDVAISLFNRNEKNKNNQLYVKDFDNIINCFKLWEKYVVQSENYLEKKDLNIITIKFEDLLENKTKTLERTKNFLGKSFSNDIDYIDGSRTKRFNNNYQKYKELIKYAKTSLVLEKYGYAEIL